MAAGRMVDRSRGCIVIDPVRLHYRAGATEHEWLHWPNGSAKNICQIGTKQQHNATIWLAYTEQPMYPLGNPGAIRSHQNADQDVAARQGDR